MAYKYRVLIGGIGDDAHSVGTGLIALGFKEAGYYVWNMGIRNPLADFFEYAPDFDIIMMSNKNGHAELFMEKFPEMLRAFQFRDNTPKLWYLGGSLSVSESDHQVKKHFLGMGFTNVYPKPIPFMQILENVKRDIARYDLKMKDTTNNEKKFKKSIPKDDGMIADGKWDRQELDRQRVEVLREYETGKEVLCHDDIPARLNGILLDELLWSNKMKGNAPLFQPRTGVADINAQIELLQYLEANGSDISSVQLDACSRSKMYGKAKQGIEMSLDRKSSLLNGFPIPVYGVKKVRHLVNSLNNPFQLRAGGPDHRFTYEIALKAGISGLEGGFICYLFPYDKDTSPTQSLRYWQYIDRLCAAHYEDHGTHINREYFGVLTATLIEPGLAIVINIIQAILSAQQGIKSITVGYAEQGNRTQDIAAIAVMEEMAIKYLHRFKFHETRITTVFHQFMAAFPADVAKAEELILNSSITATLAGATKVMVKTAMEAIRIPDKYDNANALKICKRGVLMADKKTINFPGLDIEKDIIRKEVDAIMEVIIELGNGSVARGAIKAIEEGIIDIPWAPNKYNAGNVVAIRDINGAVRFTEFGNLPFSNEIREFHLGHVNIRKNMERDPSLFSLLEKDLSRIWKNEYQRWPLDGCYVD